MFQANSRGLSNTLAYYILTGVARERCRMHGKYLVLRWHEYFLVPDAYFVVLIVVSLYAPSL